MATTHLLTTDGLRLAVQEYGDPQAPVTVLLAHCWTLSHRDWDYQVRDLMGEFGHRVRILTWDHRGHGDSDKPPLPECTIELLAKDMGELIDTFAPNGKLVLGGHSIGGMTMMALAEQRPEVLQRVVGAAFVSTSSGNMDTVTLGLPEMGRTLRSQIPRMLALRSRTLTPRARRRAPILERQVMRRFVFGRPARLGDVAVAVEALINCPSATVVGFYEDCMRHDRADALKSYDGIPVRVLVGSRDLLTPPSHARRITDHVSSAELLIAPDAGHMLPFERDVLVSATLAKLTRPHLG